jgi:phosphate transport system substrate-binding protein
MSKIIYILFIFSLSLSINQYCLAEVLHYQGTHILTYSTMAGLAVSFEQQTGIHIEIQGGGCADGVVVVVKDRYEMGGLCCPLKPSELDELGLIGHAVARDIKTVIVNKKNPLNNITTEQLLALHQGKITTWKELGWIDKPVAVIYRKHCLDRLEPVRTFLEIDDQLNNLAPKAIKVRTDKELIDYVEQFPTATGITSNVFVRNEDVKILTIDTIKPTAENVANGSYPFSAVLYIVTKGKPDPDTKRFLDFIRSDQGQAIVKENLAGIP